MDNDQPIVIRGSDPNESIEFLAVPELSDSSFNIAASYAQYRIEETSVTLVGIDEFLAKLASFEETRTGFAKLEGTYDFRLEVRPFEHRGDALIRFNIAHLLLLPDHKHGSCRLDAAFVVQADRIASMLRELNRMRTGANGTPCNKTV